MPQAKGFTPGFSMAGAVDLESLKHAAGEGETPAAGGYVIDVTERNFQSVVESSTSYPIVLLIWVANDKRCFPMATQLAQAVDAMEGQLQLARVDVASEAAIAQAFGMTQAPALFALVGGRPMPIIDGLPSEEEMPQIVTQTLPQIVQIAAQSGVQGRAPYIGEGQPAEQAQEEPVPAEHAEAVRLVEQGEYAAAARAYEQVLERDPNDQRARAEHAMALLLARSADADVRAVRQMAADNADSVDAQLAVADIDMIGGQIEDAFDRLLDFAASHPQDIDQVRQRLLEYFQIPPAGDERLARARRRLATLLY